jgi:6-phosphogluconate dehydrogenase
MPKVVALQMPATNLAAFLTQRGYKVIEFNQLSRSRTQVDAVLYTHYRPEETISTYMSYTDNSDPITDDFPSAIMLNITGLQPDQVLNELDKRLRHRQYHH